MGPSFLPALRENVRVRGGTVVNLTLNTLYEVIQWLPAQPRAGNSQKDDWAWTLRSAANRPLLRWLEDGPLVVVTDGSGAQAEAEGPAHGDGPGRNLWRKWRAFLRDSGRYAVQTAASCWRGSILRPAQMQAWSRCWASGRI